MDKRIGIILLFVMGLAGCREPSTSSPAPKPKPAQNAPAVQAVNANVSRDPNPPVALEDVDVLTAGINAFGLDMYQRLARDQAEANLFFSPYSISETLAMAYAGARGATAQQMAQALHFSEAGPDLHARFDGLFLALENQKKQFSAKDHAPFSLNSANAIWGQKGHVFDQDYLDTLARWYGAGLMQLDFSEPEQARKTINTWVAQSTEQKILDLIPPGIISADMRMVLTNAVYFKARWLNKFYENGTEPGAFHTPGGAAVTTPMMHQQNEFAYVAGDGYTALSLPYDDSSIQMAVILPDEGRFQEIQDSLNPDMLNALLTSLVSRSTSGEVVLTMPKFQLTSEFSLAQVLSDLGMPDAFSPGAADFSGMDGMSGPDGIFIANVIHKAFIDVNENGTQAAAATAVTGDGAAAPQAPPVTITLDRPFIYCIHDAHTNLILFMGRVMDPSA